MAERLALFALSAGILLVDLAVALTVAAYLGVIPKAKVQGALAVASRAPVIGGLFAKEAPPAKAAPARKGRGKRKP